MSQRPTTPPPDEKQIIAERRAKLKAWRAKGNAFPNKFMRDSLAGDLHEKYENNERDSMDLNPVVVKVAGRMMLKRAIGKASFATIQDMSGSIQLYLTDSYPGKEQHEEFKHYDAGDIIGAEGVLFKTKTSELTVRVKQLHLLTKSLRPLPEKFHGLTDQRYRQRYLDMITNEDTRLTFVQRSRIIQAMRAYFLDKRYLEVETPMMHPIPGGVSVRPFITHHNALDMDFYLRISPDLHLKRLVVGGLQQVFEINRSFSYDGILVPDNPELTILKFYVAYRTHYYLMQVIEWLIREVALTVLGTAKVSYQGREIDFEKPFTLHTIATAIKQYHPDVADETLNSRDSLIKKLTDLNVKFRPLDGIGTLQFNLFENTVATQLFEPTYVFNYPVEVSPSARCSDKDPNYTERFGLYIAGHEIANGFSELNDPEDQAARFQEQAKQKAGGDLEAMHYDADYIRALEYGLPPAAGASIAIDRLVMILTDRPSIRDVILFPHMGPELIPSTDVS